MIFGSCHFLFHQFTQRDEPYQIIADMDALTAFSATFIRSTDTAFMIIGHNRKNNQADFDKNDIPIKQQQ